MSIYESSISNPKKQLEFYKDLTEQLQRENERLKNNNKTFVAQKEEAYKIANKEYEENQSLKDKIEKAIEKLNKLDFDKFVYSKTGLKDIKRDLLKMLGEKE